MEDKEIKEMEGGSNSETLDKIVPMKIQVTEIL